MLELKNIHKDYPAGDGLVHALKGVSVRFRESEFVSILGPSGCGKTTMLNIIGGLDQYTQGDLIINSRSTRDFKDRDWDAYRNHSIGFVFQSYNLIPHQTVLQNVELALTLSGVSKAERRQRAIRALEEVGLGNQLRKKPGQMSGGQMQRVAIARALVNNPDIILADEPTGALDTETSVQVMEILKQVAKDRLVVMVTHNPDLAQTYSTRIIRMLDGEIISDSDPLPEREYNALRTADLKKQVRTHKERKPSMSLPTAFGLSLKNLISKKGRTILTSFAGSIGIIGIALIYAVSQGMTTYINTMQEDTLSSYPLTIQETTVDMGSMMSIFLESAESELEHGNDAVYSKGMLYDLVNAMNSLETSHNDLTSFRAYLEQCHSDPADPLHDAISGIQYTYDLELPVYTKNVDGTIIESDAQALLQEMMSQFMGTDVSAMFEFREQTMGSMMGSTGGATFQVWQEMLPGENGRLVSELLEKQYDLVYGSWPTEYNEIVLVVDQNNELADMTLYALGLKSTDEMERLMDAAVNGTTLSADDTSWSYEEICSMEFRVILPADCFRLDESTGLYTDLRQTDAGVRYLYDNGLALKVSGIIRPSADAVSAMLSGSIGYTSRLTEYVISQAQNAPAVEAQEADPATDIFTGLPFEETTGQLTDEEKEAAFRAHITSLTDGEKAETYIAICSIPSEEQLDALLEQSMAGVTREDMESTLIRVMTAQMGMSEADVGEYTAAMDESEITELFRQLMTEQLLAQYALQTQAQMAAMSPEQLTAALEMAMEGYTTAQCASYYDQILVFSDSTYEENLVKLGRLDLDSPASINLYAATFESKEVIEDAIESYNQGVEELKQIQYTDYVGIMMRSVTSIINAVTYVLIAFVAISLVVSSIMIGVITLISVQERTKEIGILRAIGASKKNVSSMFTAETVIIGFISGALGVAVTWLLCFPVNAIIQSLTGISSLKAFLPMQAALILIGISILLTLLSGIIPSRSAAKKDPVVALRTE